MQPNPYAPPLSVEVPGVLAPPPPPPGGDMRVTASLAPAWAHMRRVLLQSSFGTWFSFGLIFFLESCLDGGGGGGNNLRLPSGGGGGGTHPGGGPTPASPFGTFFDDPKVVALVIIGAIVVMVPIMVLAYWLGTRGRMMAIHSVAVGRADVTEAWRATKDAGYALFRFHLVVSGAGLVLMIPLIIAAVLMAIPIFQGDATWDDSWPGLLAVGATIVILGIPFGIVQWFATHFISPIMLKERIGARAAWARFWPLARGQLGPLVGFFFLHLFISIGAGIVGIVAGYLTCCVGLLPVLHQTLMSPWYVFERAWSLEILASLSPDFDLIQRAPVGFYGPYAQPQYAPR